LYLGDFPDRASCAGIRIRRGAEQSRGVNHRRRCTAWFDSQIANGLIEGINSLIQAAKAKARGYRSTRTLKAITYLIAGKLDLKLPT
jgi:hypothetical protein